jgi:hypothetical protein
MGVAIQQVSYVHGVLDHRPEVRRLRTPCHPRQGDGRGERR